MLKLMFVDDEPYILQGLQILIDYKKEGFEVVAVMSNGKEALDYLKENKVDLIISDIQMPVMTGLELLENIRKDNISDARFAILTGYDKFSYAQTAIKFNSIDYIVKPVKEEDMIALLRKVSNLNKESIQNVENLEKMEDAYLARNVISILKGKFDPNNVEYVESHMQLVGAIRYVDIEVLFDKKENEEDDSDMRLIQRQLHNACREVLRENVNHFIFDVSYDENSYDVGFIFCENMATRKDMTEMEFFSEMLERIEHIVLKTVRMTCGKKVNDISSLAKSYSSCCMLNSIKGFRSEKKVYIYEDEVQVNSEGVILCKKSIDECIKAIELNDKDEITMAVEKLYDEMQSNGGYSNIINLNINYLLFQLIHLASEHDDNVNQEEIVQYISENSIESTLQRGSCQHMKRFAFEYADYLSGLRKNKSRGVLSFIEEDIREHYAENISLKTLSDKYYMNSSYLGQLFRKKYDQSFKDYLTNYRINEAAKQLIDTDKKINQIAEDVGYKDSDYFIRKFIELKGCTPSKYRKNNSDIH